MKSLFSENDRKVRPWCNKEVKDRIQAKKLHHNSWFQNKTEPSFRNAEAQKFAEQIIEKVQTAILG